MAKKFKKIALITTACISFLLALMIVFSPYKHQDGFAYKLVKTSILIDAPVEKVYSYLGNSDNARHWSVFVNHIEPLNSAEIADGAVGSIRRCYCQEDEQGQQWDETTTEVIPNIKRQLIIYNLVDFPLEATGLATEQLYKRTADGKCELAFTVFFKDEKPSLANLLKVHFGAYFIQDIFEDNLANIKKENEKSL